MDLDQGGTAREWVRVNLGPTLGWINMVQNTTVQMYQNGQGNWVAYGPGGAPISTPGTTTQGLQEAINYAATNGFGLWVAGGPIVGSVDYGRIYCSTPLTIPTANKGQVRISGVTLIIDPSTPSQDGMTFDTMDMMDFDFLGGQLLYTGTGAAVRLNAVHDNGESFIGVTSSRFHFSSIVCIVSKTNLAPDPTKGTGFRVSAANGVVINNMIEMEEINAGLIGFLVDTPSGGNSFTLNEIHSSGIHGQNTMCLQVGQAVGAGTTIYGNRWYATLTAVSNAFNTYGSYDIFDLAISAGSGTGIIFSPSAAQNIINIARNQTATQVSDGSTSRTNIITSPNFPNAFPSTFATLPSTPMTGMVRTVSDSTTNVWGATIAGGGGNIVLAFYNGTNWTVAGK